MLFGRSPSTILTSIPDESGLFLRRQPLPHSPFGFRWQGLRRKSVNVPFMLVCKRAQPAELTAVTTTPLAEEQMDAQTDSPRQRQRMIQFLGLQASRFPATGGNLTCPASQGRQHLLRPLHYVIRLAATRRRFCTGIRRTKRPGLTQKSHRLAAEMA